MRRKLMIMALFSASALLLVGTEPGRSQTANESQTDNAGMGTMAMLGRAPMGPKGDINPLSATITGQVDHIAGGVALRNLGSGTIRVSGAPATASVELAVLYFGFICSGPCPSFQTVAFDGNLVDGFLIGTAGAPCWPGTAYGAYSVGVTPLVPDVNGEHSISGVPSTLTTGEDPWSTPAVPPLAEGASLVVVYSDPSLSPGVVYINDGAVFFSATQDFVHSVSPPLTGSSRKFSTLGADGQVGTTSTFGNPGISGEKTFIGPSLAALTQIAGPGATQDVDSDWNGTDGQPLNQLWDTHTHSFVGILPAGATSYAVRYVSSGDCMDWTAHVLTAR